MKKMLEKFTKYVIMYLEEEKQLKLEYFPSEFIPLKKVNKLGLLSFLKKSNDLEPPIPESERKYYQPDSYYTSKSYPGTQFERDVIPFETRKKSSIPSARGLYVAEILLLEYCSYGTYPHPKNGYPGFWWFEYGIRNVGAKLESLEERGFIQMASAKESVPKLTLPQLKEIFAEFQLPAKGKKAELVQYLLDNFDNTDLEPYIPERKYALTELGKLELMENRYVPYMHKNKLKTTEDARLGPVFNVWSINLLLGKKSINNWESIVKQKEGELIREREKRNFGKSTR